MKSGTIRRVPVEKHDHWGNFYEATHIEYKRTCKYCDTEYWARKKDGQYCSNACRNLLRHDNIRLANS